MKKILIFGSGAFGLKVLEYLGKEYVYAFCDNECEEISEKNGIVYIPFYALVKEYNNYILLIAMNKKNYHEVANQLLENEIQDFVLLTDEVQKKMQLCVPYEFVELLNDDKERMRFERNQFIQLKDYMEIQLSQLKAISDIRNLKPATGYISGVQRRIVMFTQKLFEEVKKLQLKPFVVGGSLLGLYRHDGFIPWDDDVDFGLMRDDYMVLLRYGKENFIYVEEKAAFDVNEDRYIEEVFKYHPNEYIMVVSPNCLQIRCGTSEIDACTVDFFAYDYYSEEYSFDAHKELIKKCADIRYFERGNSKVLDTIEHNNNTCSISNKIYFGLDNMDSFVCQNDDWIPADVLFPLKKVTFEGIECYAPNNQERMLDYFYKEYNTFPDDLSCHHLLEVVSEKLKRDYVYCGILVTSTKMMYRSLKIYERLRKNSIYCIFVVMRKYCDTKKTYSEILRELDQLKVECIKTLDSQLDFLIIQDEKIKNNISISSVTMEMVENEDLNVLKAHFAKIVK